MNALMLAVTKTCSVVNCKKRPYYMQGGQRGFCAKHGGLPYCRENGCTARQSYKSGGVRGFCAKHGGHPVCEVKGCTMRQFFVSGGKRGFCGAHGGIPPCTVSGCTSLQFYRTGGKKGFCGKHGGIPPGGVLKFDTPQLDAAVPKLKPRGRGGGGGYARKGGRGGRKVKEEKMATIAKDLVDDSSETEGEDGASTPTAQFKSQNTPPRSRQKASTPELAPPLHSTVEEFEEKEILAKLSGQENNVDNNSAGKRKAEGEKEGGKRSGRRRQRGGTTSVYSLAIARRAAQDAGCGSSFPKSSKPKPQLNPVEMQLPPLSHGSSSPPPSRPATKRAYEHEKTYNKSVKRRAVAAKTIQIQGNFRVPLRVAIACSECHRQKIKCEAKRPCGPCIMRGEADSCQDFRKEEGKKANNRQPKRPRRLADRLNPNFGVSRCYRNKNCIRPLRHCGHCKLRKPTQKKIRAEMQCYRNKRCIRPPRHTGHCKIPKDLNEEIEDSLSPEESPERDEMHIPSRKNKNKFKIHALEVDLSSEADDAFGKPFSASPLPNHILRQPKQTKYSSPPPLVTEGDTEDGGIEDLDEEEIDERRIDRKLILLEKEEEMSRNDTDIDELRENISAVETGMTRRNEALLGISQLAMAASALSRPPGY
ncbi:hypothetical protein AAMO2058_000483800 [Amorphochlora amoebiformis]